ncbi:MAG TPA: alpha/beta fold hydrolase [Alphaproteobacteria bacterium]|nr:alpha/beta fold hydrolase [Alphaproteobacteria bacterium]
MSSREPFSGDGVRGVLHRPGIPGTDGLVLAHGAGGNCDAPVLVAAADAFCGAGLAVLRIDLPFRQRRPRGPPSPHTAEEDRAGLRRAVAAMRKIAPGRIFLGGHSYGGRQATLLAAEDPAVAAGLLLLSYPLHPPDKPDSLRTRHFPQLQTPGVFVHGTTDPFGTTDEMQGAVALIPAPTKLIPVEGTGHDLKRGRLDWRPVIDALRATEKSR